MLTKNEINELKDKIKKRRAIKKEDIEDIEITPDDIAEDIKELKTNEEIQEYLDDVHDVDIAEYLEEYDETDEILKVLNALDNEDRAAILEEAEEELQIKIVNLIDEDDMLEIFSYMYPDDIVDILGILDFAKRKSLLNKMKRSDANKLRELLGYDAESAGGIMTTQYIAFSGNLKKDEIISKIMLIAPKTEYIQTIFVQNDQGQIMGYAELRDIFTMTDDEKLIDITDDNIKYVYPEVDQEEVAQLVSKYGLKVVPVLSKKKNMLGIITIDDVIDVIQEENTEDILKMAGTSDDEDLDTSLFDSIKKRLPWLLINLITAFLASLTVSLFSGTIDRVVALAAVMPIVSGMGGNAGTQSLAVTIRSIALGEYEDDKNLLISFKYVMVGFFNGIVLGLVCAGIIYYLFELPYLSLVVLMSMIGNCIIACLVGYLIPVILERLEVDPAMASSVLLTTVTDVCGFFLFLGLATVFIDKLI